ncbi:head-tail connector protein [Xenophilus sp.]|uniref:head-tail connector protein n=1 Tax=Xenophilus sp. TaxID=1873499 RepID=UPI0037DBFB35
MSVIQLAAVKALLRHTHDSDDVMLQSLIDAAESELCRFLNRRQLPTLPQDYPPLFDANGDPLPEVVATPANVAPEVLPCVAMLVKAQADDVTPADAAALRRAAEVKMYPYRVGLGV